MALKITEYYLDERGDALLTRARKRLTRRRVPSFPRTVQVETVAGCNADCVWCPYGKEHPGPPAGRMSSERFARIVDECARHHVTRFSPYLTNEPLLDPRIHERIRTVKERIPRCRIVLTTNGSLLTPEVTDRLLNLDGALHSLYVSFQGIGKVGYEKSVGAGIAFERVLHNVNHFLAEMRARRLTRPRVWVSMVATTLIDAPRAVAYWKSRGVRAKYTALENRGGSVSGTEAWATSRMGYYSNCPRMFKQAYICFDGTMVACCTDYARREVLGNVFDHSIEEIWNGARAGDLRMRYLSGRIHTLTLCGSCRIDQEREIEG